MEKVIELKVTVRQFLTKPNPKYPDKKPVPMRTMFGYSTQATDNGIYLVLKGKPEPSSVCLHCGRTLKHPVSVLYGIGPTCGGHFHISNFETEEELNEAMEDIKKKLADVVWEGWLPKGHIEIEATGEEIEPFGEVEVPEKKAEEPKANRIYPELTFEQEALIERAKFNWMENPSLMKPIEIWIEKRGAIKLVLEGKGKKTTVKIDKAGERISAGLPYAPKYKMIYALKLGLEAPEKVKEKVVKAYQVDVKLVDALAEELSCLL